MTDTQTHNFSLPLMLLETEDYPSALQPCEWFPLNLKDHWQETAIINIAAKKEQWIIHKHTTKICIK